MLQDLFTLFSVTAPLALMILLWVMAQISRRFGEVTHRPPLYRGFYLSITLLVSPLIIRMLAMGLDDPHELVSNHIGALLHDLPLLGSIGLAVFIAWRYWGWLVYARDGQHPVKPQQTGPQ